jgi:hypothetical protein
MGCSSCGKKKQLSTPKKPLETTTVKVGSKTFIVKR